MKRILPFVPTLRPALDRDGDGIAALIAAVFAEYEGCPFERDEFPELDRPATHYAGKGGVLLVLEDAHGRIVGSAAISRADDAGVFEIHKVYLTADLRGRGHAGRLFDAVVGEARRRGARSLKLWTDTRFLSGHRFYEKRGFVRQPVTRYLADATRAWEYAYILAPLS